MRADRAGFEQRDSCPERSTGTGSLGGVGFNARHCKFVHTTGSCSYSCADWSDDNESQDQSVLRLKTIVSVNTVVSQCFKIRWGIYQWAVKRTVLG